MPPAVAGAFFRWLYAIDVRAVLPVISAPTLVLHTVENPFHPIEHGRYLAQHTPNARLVELPGADVSVFLGSAVGAVVIERRGTELAGIAVHLACRVCDAAQPGEVLVSRTVVDLVAGSGTRFDDRGEHELKGIPAAWRLFAVAN
jgi:hypothetical protein